jgi:hypothetical protein
MTRPITRPDGSRRVFAPEWNDTEKEAVEQLLAEPHLKQIEQETFIATLHWSSGQPQVAIVRKQ